MKIFLTLLIASASLAGAATLTECPAIGATTGCNVLVTIDASNKTTVTSDASQPPYDNSEDSTIGVLNNSSSTIYSLPISSTKDIFGFEGDGMCSSAFGAPGNCKLGLSQGDPYDYSGDFVTFSITDAYHGVVNFTGGLKAGSSTYFSLEDTLVAADITPGNPNPSSTPEPASYALLALGLSGFGLIARRRAVSSRN